MPCKHRDDERASRRRCYRRQREERVAAGCCTKCGRQPPEPDRTLCAECGHKRREADRARYARTKARGLLYGGKCVEAKRLSARAGSKRRYEARAAAGLCVKCGRRPPPEGRTRCEACLARRNAAERDQWKSRRASGACGKCGAPSGGAARCDTCAAAQSYNPEAKNAAARRRYWRRRAVSRCTECGAYSAGASRCVPCARRSYLRSGEHRGLPMAPASFRVVVIDTGEDLGCWESEAELAACLAFSRLSTEDVEIVGDVPVMSTITSWT